MVCRDPALQGIAEVAETDREQISFGDDRAPLLDHTRDPVALIGRGQPDAAVGEQSYGVLRSCPGEDEVDRRQQVGGFEAVNDIHPRGGARWTRTFAATPGSIQGVPLGGTHPVARQPLQFGVHLPLGVIDEEVEQAVVGHHLLPQRNRPMLLEDDLRVPPHSGHPGPELLDVRDRRGQRRDRHGLRELDDQLFPDRTPFAIGEVVHLVEHHVSETGQVRRGFVHHVPQDLGGHHHRLRMAVDADITGQQTHVGLSVLRDEVPVLLVGQGLDRGGVEGLAAGLSGQVDRVLPHDRLPAARGSGDQHIAALVERLAGLYLEGVEREVVAVAERGQVRAGSAALTCRGVPFGGRGHTCTLRANPPMRRHVNRAARHAHRREVVPPARRQRRRSAPLPPRGPSRRAACGRRDARRGSP